MIYLAILGYLVSIYEVYKLLAPNWSANEITLLDVLLLIPILIITLTPILNSAVTIAIWSDTFLHWASATVVIKRGK
jgi:hypothetical protein